MTSLRSSLIPQGKKPDPSPMQEAIASLLHASGFSTDHPHLKDTPRRVAEAWLHDLLDGYALDPATALQGAFSSSTSEFSVSSVSLETSVSPASPDRCPPSDASSSEMILLRDIAFHSLCPHHLLPFFGRVHLAYIPRHTIVGFSQLATLVRCLTHRLTLQEIATHAIADALLCHLQAHGAACVITATQLCMSLRDPSTFHTPVTTSAFLGAFQTRPDLQALLLR